MPPVPAIDDEEDSLPPAIEPVVRRRSEAPAAQPTVTDPNAPQPIQWSADPAQRRQQVQTEIGRRRTQQVQQVHPNATSAEQQRLAAQVDPRAAREFAGQAEEQHQFQQQTARAAAVAQRRSEIDQQRARNNQREATMRGTGQQFYADANGDLQPVIEAETNRALYHASPWEPAAHPKDGTPALSMRDRYGQRQYRAAPMRLNPSDANDEYLYADYSKYGIEDSPRAMKITDAANSSDMNLRALGTRGLVRQKTGARQKASADAMNSKRAVDLEYDTARNEMERLKAEQEDEYKKPKPDETAVQAKYKRQLELEDSLKPGGALHLKQQTAKLGFDVTRATLARDAYADQEAVILARLAAEGVEDPESDPTYLENRKYLEATNGALTDAQQAQGRYNALMAARGRPAAPAAPAEAPEPSKLAEGAKAFARGATAEGVYAATEGGARAFSQSPVRRTIEGIQDAITERVQGFPLTDEQKQSRATDRAAAGRQTGATALDETVKGYADQTAKLREQIRRALPVDQKFAESALGKIAQGVGQAAGTLPVGVAGSPALLAASVGQIYDEAFQDAKQSGADDATAHSAAMKYLPAAGLDFLSDRLIVGKLLKPLVGKATVGTILKDVLATAASEGVTEGAQQAYLNQIASKLQGYDPKRPFDKEVLDSAMVGAVVGGGVTAVGQGAKAALGPTAEGDGTANTQPPTTPPSVPVATPTAPLPTSSGTIDVTVGGRRVSGDELNAVTGTEVVPPTALPPEHVATLDRVQALAEQAASGTPEEQATANAELERMVAEQAPDQQAQHIGAQVAPVVVAPEESLTPVAQEPVDASAPDVLEVDSMADPRSFEVGGEVQVAPDVSGTIVAKGGDHLIVETPDGKRVRVQSRQTIPFRSAEETAAADAIPPTAPTQADVAPTPLEVEFADEAPAAPVPIGDRSARPTGAAEEAVVAEQRRLVDEHLAEQQPPATPNFATAKSEEVDAWHEANRQFDNDAVVRVFGPERAKEYNKLQRTANGSDNARADAASAKIAEMEGELTEKQQDALFGRNLPDTFVHPDDSKALRATVADIDSAESGSQLARASSRIIQGAMRDVADGKKVEGRQGEMLMRVMKRAKDLGVDARNLVRLAFEHRAGIEGDDVFELAGVTPEQYRRFMAASGEKPLDAITREVNERAQLERPADAAPTSEDTPTPETVEGDKLSKSWTSFSPDSGSLGIPRAEMPQVASEHRGALVNFLKARGIAAKSTMVMPDQLRPTQAEFSPAKVQAARDHTGSERPILISSDGHVVDGHHQWLAGLDDLESPMPVIRLNAPIDKVLAEMKEFPSAEAAKGATPKAATAEPTVSAATPRLSDRAIAALEKAKIGKPGMVRSGDPFTIAYDGAIDLAILGIRAGRAAADVVKLAIDRFKAKHPNYTPDELGRVEQTVRSAVTTADEVRAKKIAAPGEAKSRVPESLRAVGTPAEDITYDVRNQNARMAEARAMISKDGEAKAEAAISDRNLSPDTRVALGGVLLEKKMAQLRDAKPADVPALTREIQRLAQATQSGVSTESGQGVAMHAKIYQNLAVGSAMEYVKDTNAKRLEKMGGKDMADAAQDAADALNKAKTPAERDAAIDKLKERYTTGPVRRALDQLKRVEVAKELNKLGVLTRDDLVDVAGNALGIPGIEQSKLKHIAELADAVDKATNHAERSRAELALADTLSIYKGVNPLDLEASILTLNILSGPTTQAANIEGNALNLLAQLGTTAAVNPTKLGPIWEGLKQGIPLAWDQAKSIMATGRGTRDFQDRTLGAGNALANVDYARDFPALNPKVGDLLTARARAVEKIGRFMKAADAVFYYPAREAYARLVATKLLEGKFTGPELAAKVSDALHTTPAAFEQARQQAAREGYTGIDAGRRVSDIIEEQRAKTVEGKEAVKQSERFAAEATYNNEPVGIAGVFYRKLSSMVRDVNVGGVPLLKPWAMFLRVPANVFNSTMNFTPLGALRATAGMQGEKYRKGATGEGQWRNFSKDERNRLYLQSVIGTTLMAALAQKALSDDDDEVDVTATGPTNAAQRAQLKNAGWNPYSIKVGNKWISYRDSPLLIPLALVGHVADDLKYQKSSKDETRVERLLKATAQAPRVIFDTSMLSGMADLMSNLSGHGDATAIGRTLGSLPANLTIPYNRLLQQIDQSFDDQSYKANPVVNAIPFARRTGQPQSDVQGRPQTYSPASRFATTEKGDPVDSVLREKNIFIPDAGKDTKIGNRVMTEEEHEKYRRMSGQRIRIRLQAIVPRLQVMSQEMAQKEVKRITDEERDKVKPLVGRK